MSRNYILLVLFVTLHLQFTALGKAQTNVAKERRSDPTTAETLKELGATLNAAKARMIMLEATNILSSHRARSIHNAITSSKRPEDVIQDLEDKSTYYGSKRKIFDDIIIKPNLLRTSVSDIAELELDSNIPPDLMRRWKTRSFYGDAQKLMEESVKSIVGGVPFGGSALEKIVDYALSDSRLESAGKIQALNAGIQSTLSDEDLVDAFRSAVEKHAYGGEKVYLKNILNTLIGRNPLDDEEKDDDLTKNNDPNLILSPDYAEKLTLIKNGGEFNAAILESISENFQSQLLERLSSQAEGITIEDIRHTRNAFDNVGRIAENLGIMTVDLGNSVAIAKATCDAAEMWKQLSLPGLASMAAASYFTGGVAAITQIGSIIATWGERSETEVLAELIGSLSKQISALGNQISREHEATRNLIVDMWENLEGRLDSVDTRLIALHHSGNKSAESILWGLSSTTEILKESIDDVGRHQAHALIGRMEGAGGMDAMVAEQAAVLSPFFSAESQSENFFPIDSPLTYFQLNEYASRVNEAVSLKNALKESDEFLRKHELLLERLRNYRQVLSEEHDTQIENYMAAAESFLKHRSELSALTFSTLSEPFTAVIPEARQKKYVEASHKQLLRTRTRLKNQNIPNFPVMDRGNYESYPHSIGGTFGRIYSDNAVFHHNQNAPHPENIPEIDKSLAWLASEGFIRLIPFWKINMGDAADFNPPVIGRKGLRISYIFGFVVEVKNEERFSALEKILVNYYGGSQSDSGAEIIELFANFRDSCRKKGVFGDSAGHTTFTIGGRGNAPDGQFEVRPDKFAPRGDTAKAVASQIFDTYIRDPLVRRTPSEDDKRLVVKSNGYPKFLASADQIVSRFLTVRSETIRSSLQPNSAFKTQLRTLSGQISKSKEMMEKSYRAAIPRFVGSEYDSLILKEMSNNFSTNLSETARVEFYFSRLLEEQQFAPLLSEEQLFEERITDSSTEKRLLSRLVIQIGRDQIIRSPSIPLIDALIDQVEASLKEN